MVVTFKSKKDQDKQDDKRKKKILLSMSEDRHYHLTYKTSHKDQENKLITNRWMESPNMIFFPLYQDFFSESQTLS